MNFLAVKLNKNFYSHSNANYNSPFIKSFLFTVNASAVVLAI